MSNLRKFDFNKSYEEFAIAGKDYKMEFNDEKMIEYNKSFDKYYTESKKINEMDTTNFTAKENEKVFKVMQDLTFEIIDTLLFKDASKELYEASGRSLYNLIEMVEFLSEIVGEKMEKIRNDKKKKYIVKKNK